MNVIAGNFANPTIALIQWAVEHKLRDVVIVAIDTGWAAPAWQTRVDNALAYARECGLQTKQLQAQGSFAGMVRDRKSFPSTKFQWCAGFLKGLPLLAWLDEVDPSCEATILLPKRRATAMLGTNLPEYLDESEHHGDRRVWHPLYDCDDATFKALIERAGFDYLGHRSLECEPCIHSVADDFQRMDPAAIERLAQLENEVGQTMFAEPINARVKRHQEAPKTGISKRNMGCGDPYACGE